MYVSTHKENRLYGSAPLQAVPYHLEEFVAASFAFHISQLLPPNQILFYPAPQSPPLAATPWSLTVTALE